MVASADRRQQPHQPGQKAQWSERIREGAKVLKDEASNKLNKVAAALRKEADQMLEGPKEQAAEKISSVGAVIEKAGKVLQVGRTDPLANYVNLTAERTHRAASYLRKTDLAEMTEDAAEVARRNPLTVYSAIFLVGIAAGRFLRAATDGDEQE
jgi:hypothetical protein